MFGENLGVFHGSGGDALYQLTELPFTPEGVVYRVTCDVCGTTQDITIAWAQIMQAAQLPQTNRLPVDPDNGAPWVYHPSGRIHPQIGCMRPTCARAISIGMTPAEAATKIAQAQQARIIR